MVYFVLLSHRWSFYGAKAKEIKTRSKETLEGEFQTTWTEFMRLRKEQNLMKILMEISKQKRARMIVVQVQF
jgi:hypothetical protein